MRYGSNSGVGYLSKLNRIAVTLVLDILHFCVENWIDFYAVVEHTWNDNLDEKSLSKFHYHIQLKM